MKFNVTTDNDVKIGEVSLKEIVKKYKTPIYVYNKQEIERKIKELQEAFYKYFKGKIVYASKANSCLEILRIMNANQLALDVVSAGELYAALRVNVDPSQILMHGNNKSVEELRMAIDANVGRIIVDNLVELRRIIEIAKEKNKVVPILFRIIPGIEVHTHKYIKTGQKNSKFGLNLENGEAMQAVQIAIDCKNIELLGVHCHIGSQIFETVPYADAAEIMLGFMNQVKKQFGVELKELDLGGGFGIKYTETDDPPTYEDFMKTIHERMKKVCKKLKMKTPFILIEPGRSLIAEAGITLYTVGCIKGNIVCIDGGMTDNPRHILYDAKYDADILEKINEIKGNTVTIAGKCCESGDLIGEGMELQKPEVGETLAVHTTGAYNQSMSSKYNATPGLAAVMIDGNKYYLIVKRESLEDICRNDI